MITQLLYGVPSSITLAQAAIESGWNTSSLSSKYNNFFGIKSHGWDGQSINLSTLEFVGGSYQSEGANFRVYSTPYGSFKDHAKFLRHYERYDSLFSLPVTDFKRWATGLESAGYATSPKYDSDIISVIETHDLDQYDRITVAIKYIGIAALIILGVILFKRYFIPILFP